jgi:hypothetical protein
MNLIRNEDELRTCAGAEQLFACRDELHLDQFKFLYACVWPDRGRESIHAIFYKVHEGVKRTADISVEHGDDGWKAHYVIATA